MGIPIDEIYGFFFWRVKKPFPGDRINLQSLEDSKAGNTSQKYTLEKYTLIMMMTTNPEDIVTEDLAIA